MSIIRSNSYNDKLEIVKVTEFCKPETIQNNFRDEEIRIIQTEFNDKLELVHTRDRRHAIKTFQYVGYIVLPNHIIRISPKMSGISFINMVRYALGLLELKAEDFPASVNFSLLLRHHI
jgi:5-methylcytosine-specific restriction endonuclease McrBC regulatory subunit McrC